MIGDYALCHRLFQTKQTIPPQSKPFLKKQTIYPQSKPILLRQSAATAENKKNPSRKCLRDGFLYDVKAQKFTRAEALLRLRKDDPVFGKISPEEFIPIAEQHGLFPELGNFVFTEVAKFLSFSKIYERGIEKIDINLSSIQCMQDNLCTSFLEIFNYYQIDPKYINLEIRESSLLSSSSTIFENINCLRTNGASFSLNEYGTGISNAINILNYKFSTIKIDISLIQAAMSEERAKIILERTITMLKELNLNVVAIGVKNKNQAGEVMNMGVDMIQAFCYSKPLPAQEFVNFIK